MSTDKDWNKWGSQNPYYGVISNPKYLGKKLDSADLKSFYDSGYGDARWIVGGVGKLGANRFRRSVDFGCGAGRIAIAMSKYSDKVLGIDVSRSIIKEARRNTPKNIKSKIKYTLIDPIKDKIPTTYDFVYSYIVLQHIPVNRGNKIIQELLDGLDTNGYAALHITHRHDAKFTKKAVVWLRNHSLIIHYALNVLRGNKWNTPRMRMYIYDLEVVLEIFKRYRIQNPIQIPTDHGGYIGSMIIGKKTSKE